MALGTLLAGGAMAADVNLAKPDPDDPPRWQGRTVGEVLDAASVERVILLRAVTSAPADLDLANLRRTIADHAHVPLQPRDGSFAPWRVRQGTWHAVLLMRSGRVFELEIDLDGRDRRACLLADDGARGCFELVRREPPTPAGGDALPTPAPPGG
ncbi:hypothetical protein FZO89_05075 [Luteimonas viscosa]|uniref:Uncharacterized protein n=1 Tax=Luteimonas viscosa TaxID=1132694 RepID=A0A5D4XLX3_9GAMM|nr:hypothetical protein [Luteimonas viscosa]TYT25678.1 hypothetical protein FZO89_05075 [Luteimonas viscosa]